MANIDKFLEVVGVDYCHRNDNFEENAPKPTEVMERLEKVVSSDVMGDVEELLSDFIVDFRDYCLAQGMKAAIEIMDGNYYSGKAVQ